jgi:hypothetical protein
VTACALVEARFLFTPNRWGATAPSWVAPHRCAARARPRRRARAMRTSGKGPWLVGRGARTGHRRPRPIAQAQELGVERVVARRDPRRTADRPPARQSASGAELRHRALADARAARSLDSTAPRGLPSAAAASAALKVSAKLSPRGPGTVTSSAAESAWEFRGRRPAGLRCAQPSALAPMTHGSGSAAIQRGPARSCWSPREYG